MITLRTSIFLVSATFSVIGIPGTVAYGQDAPPPAQDATAGAQGRGVRIIAPDAPPPAPVTPAPQVHPAPVPSPVHAVTPAPTGAMGTLPILKACDRPVASPTLRFSDPAGFDARLRGKLRRGRTVTVDMESPYKADSEAPAPLGAWLNEIQKSGGSVTVTPYCAKGRGFGQFLTRIFGGGPAEPYKAARRYDAVLHVDSLDQVVTQIAFTRRKAAR